jgi:hypothetical protein
MRSVPLNFVPRSRMADLSFRPFSSKTSVPLAVWMLADLHNARTIFSPMQKRPRFIGSAPRLDVPNIV